MEPVLLEARDLIVRYGRTSAVSGVSLQVHTGEVVGLIGPDGAGKTSTLRVLGGLMPKTGGRAEAFGRDAWSTRRRLHDRLGYMAQSFALYGDLTVDENVRFFSMLYGVPNWKTRRSRFLERVGLAPFRHRLADKLSGGMRQKLALTCTLMHSPEVLLLDEPTTGVDPVTRREFWRLLAELVAEGLTLLVATPDLAEAERCTRVLLMNRGTVLADAPPGDLPALAPGSVVEISGGDRRRISAALSQVPAARDVGVYGAAVHARVEHACDATAIISSALAEAGLSGARVRLIPPSLEDAVLHLTKDQEAS